MSMNRFDGKTALVTGAGSGIGRATALRLASEGAAVTVIGRRVKKLDEVVAEISAKGGRALAVAGDVTKPEDLEQAVSRTVDEFGGLHLAVNNAGGSREMPTSLHEQTIDDWRRVTEVNFSSIFYSL